MKIETLQHIALATLEHVITLILSANNILVTKKLFPSERNDSMQVGTALN